MEMLEKIKEFFAKNKMLVYILPVLLILVVGGIIFLSIIGKGNEPTLKTSVTAAKSPPAGDKVSVLPETVRDTTEEEEEKKPSMVNPFGLPMRLSGVLLDGIKDAYAVIETSQNSYIVKKGDVIEKVWEIIKISEDGVVLKNGDIESVLAFPED